MRPIHGPGCPLAIVFSAVRAVLYGPMLASCSASRPRGRDSPSDARRVELHWFAKPEGPPAWWTSARRRRSLALGAGWSSRWCCRWPGSAFRKLSGGNGAVLTWWSSLVMPSIIVSLGIGLQFRPIDRRSGRSECLDGHAPGWKATAPRWALHLRPGRAPHLDPALRPPDHVRGVQPLQPVLYEEAARPRRHALRRRFPSVVLPLIGPVVGASACSASRSAGTKSPAPRRPSATSTRCRWSCRGLHHRHHVHLRAGHRHHRGVASR